MKIKELFEKANLVYSYEVFPPNLDSPIERVYDAIGELSELDPDYISVTYGAGGSTQDNRTSILTSRIKNKHNIEALAHLTCIGATKENIDKILNELKGNSIENILALRGDIPEGKFNRGDFNNSQELIRYIKEKGDFGIAAACYPEGHIETKIKDKDIEILKLKEEAGADYFITQLFYDNNYFYDFLGKVEQKGIKAPIQAGVMPVINKAQIKRTIELCGVSLPEKFIRIINKYEHDKIALRDAGIAYATEQIVDLISSGVRGIHLYTMNNPYIANSINNSVKSLIGVVNSKNVV
ncbi:MAG TPA: methylenetetrahydrofolate reductase [NAD(P)H] [Tissierellaceae bacterium]|nr:methylenetetrahydrofolate reductase [NAD(P)H] [Tissierellaceae bacterium]